jgi:Tol biopolymer transport system component
VDADNKSAWKARFRVPVIRGVQVAAGATERGLITSNVSGTFQLHAWDVPSGSLQRLTNRPSGIMAGLLSPDGRSVYYHDDAGGNELGHFVRIPFDGGVPMSITPDMPPYPTFGLRSVAGGTG